MEEGTLLKNRNVNSKVFKLFLSGLFFLGFFGSITAQNIEKDWQFSSIETLDGSPLLPINSEKDHLKLENGTFSYSLEAKDNLQASGDYLLQNKLLVLFYSQPKDTLRRYRITELTDSTLVFTENNVRYRYTSSQKNSANLTDSKINFWQLYAHQIYDKYPGKAIDSVDFIKGKEFISLEANGAYQAILNNSFSQGYWLQNNDLVVFKQKVPIAVDIYYDLIAADDHSLELRNGIEVLSFVSEGHPNYFNAPPKNVEIIESQGFSWNSLWRGALGMFSLIFIAFLFSANRRRINWRTVGIGLAFQMVIAIGVLKVTIIQNIFESVRFALFFWVKPKPLY
jgi:CNT family concentrative nucleoside transporter